MRKKNRRRKDKYGDDPVILPLPTYWLIGRKLSELIQLQMYYYHVLEYDTLNLNMP